ncbi:Choline transport protein [Lachnellula subtilissima]|uniref:Choline transport protein n=1 Tax=Lachnellula subtilissima TaxID=602034 RepID=A0A8H8U659_9HELO|nr:Choline transport protein [Lachnellula subtilissima]
MEGKINDSLQSDVEMHTFGNGDLVDGGRRRHYESQKDDDSLTQIGKKPVMKRKFGFLAILGFSCIVQSTWISPFIPALSMLDCRSRVLSSPGRTLANSYISGGPGGLIFGFLLIWMGTLAVFIGLAELSSIAPTSGGQYHWVSMLAPKSCFKGFSYVTGTKVQKSLLPIMSKPLTVSTGWLTVTGWQAAVMSSGYVSATLIQGLIEVVKPSYTPHLWHGTLMMYSVVAFAVFCTTVLGRFLPKMEAGMLFIYIVGYFCVLIPIVWLGPHGDAKSVFRTFVNNGGWSSKTLSFFVGLTGNAFNFVGADSCYHMSEEIQNASRVVPRAMVWSLIIDGTVGFTMYIGFLFSAGDLQAALDTDFIYPYIEVLVQALQSKAGVALMLSLILLVDVGLMIGVTAAASRMLWAFARDRGIPGWRRISEVSFAYSDVATIFSLGAQVNSHTSVPTAAVFTTTIFSVLIGLITVGSPVAFNDIISLCVGSLYASYLIASALLLVRRVQGKIKLSSAPEMERRNNFPGMAGDLTWGPWRVPEPFGTIINVIGVLYLIVLIFFTFWPPATPTTALTMNYDIVMLAGVAFLSSFYYYFWAYKTFNGPIIEIN